MTLKFETHGIRTSQGLNRCIYALSANREGGPAIMIFARGRRYFDPEIRVAFTIRNETDVMRDYFEDDSIEVRPDHPLFGEVVEGFRKSLRFRMKTSLHGKDYAARTLDSLDQLMLLTKGELPPAEQSKSAQASADNKPSAKPKPGMGM